MKKFLAVIVIGLISWAVAACVDFTQHTNWYYAGLIIGGIITLALVVVMIKAIFRFFKFIFTNTLYLSLATIVIGFLTFKSVLPVQIGIVSCVVTSILLTLAVVRGIARKAQTSKLFNELFSWVTGYRIELTKEEKVIKTKESKDDDVYDALIAMRYSKQEARQASDYANDEKPDADLEDRVKCALTFIGSNKVLGEV